MHMNVWLIDPHLKQDPSLEHMSVALVVVRGSSLKFKAMKVGTQLEDEGVPVLELRENGLKIALNSRKIPESVVVGASQTKNFFVHVGESTSDLVRRGRGTRKAALQCDGRRRTEGDVGGAGRRRAAGRR